MSTPLDDDMISGGDLIEAVHITQLFPIVEALEKNQTNYREDIGAADAYQVDFSGTSQANEIVSYQAGQQVVFKADNANTGASTLQIVAPAGVLAAKPLTKNGGEDLEAGDIQAGQMVLAIYNDEGSGRFDALGVLTGSNGANGDGTSFFREDYGVANAYQIDATGAGSNPEVINAYAPGQLVVFKAANANTGSATLQVLAPGGALATKALTKLGNTALVAGDIQANLVVMAVYNDAGGGRFEMMNSHSTPGSNEDGTGFYRADDGSANAYEVDCSGTGSNPHVISAYAVGQLVTFKADSANTGASTLQVIAPGGALSAKALTKFGNTALEAGDIQADQIVMAVYNDAGGGRFEMMDAPTSIPGGGGGGGGTFVGCQVVRSNDLQIFATNQTDVTWDYADINEGVDHSSGSEWIYAEQAGHYEVSLALEMEMPADETLTIEMFKGNSSSWGDYSRTKCDLPAGFNLVSLPPMLVQLEEGQRIKWMLTAANDDPTVLSGNRRSRCTMTLVQGGTGGGSSGSGTSSWLFGDGMDGDEVLTSDLDLFDHRFYRNLTIDSGVSLRTNGFKVHVSGILENNGIIHSNGFSAGDAVGDVPGQSGHGGTYNLVAWQGHWGGSGSLQEGETVYGDNLIHCARGGDGGQGSYASGGSGSGPNEYPGERFFLTTPAFLSGISDSYPYSYGLVGIAGGMGGGGGSGNDLDAAGGGGGGSGSVVWIAAKTLTGSGELQCKGGDGGAAGGTDAGGGGGGGGGLIYLLTSSESSPYSVTTDGGTGGVGGGGSGSDGSNGDGGLYVFRGGI